MNVKRHKNGLYSFAFIEYESSEQAVNSIKELDQYELFGKKMRVYFFINVVVKIDKAKDVFIVKKLVILLDNAHKKIQKNNNTIKLEISENVAMKTATTIKGNLIGEVTDINTEEDKDQGVPQVTEGDIIAGDLLLIARKGIITEGTEIIVIIMIRDDMKDMIDMIEVIDTIDIIDTIGMSDMMIGEEVAEEFLLKDLDHVPEDD